MIVLFFVRMVHDFYKHNPKHLLEKFYWYKRVIESVAFISILSIALEVINRADTFILPSPAYNQILITGLIACVTVYAGAVLATRIIKTEFKLMEYAFERFE